MNISLSVVLQCIFYLLKCSIVEIFVPKLLSEVTPTTGVKGKASETILLAPKCFKLMAMQSIVVLIKFISNSNRKKFWWLER